MKTHNIQKQITSTITLSAEEVVFIGQLLEQCSHLPAPPDFLRGILSVEHASELVRDFRALRQDIKET